MLPQPMIRSRNFLDLAHQTSEDELDNLELNGSIVSDHDEPPDFNINHIIQHNYINDSLRSHQTNKVSGEHTINDYINEDHREDGEQLTDNQKNISNNNDKSKINIDDKNMKVEQQVGLLRDLLFVERAHNEKRASNNVQLSKYIAKLQSEYLSLQADLAESLECAKRSRGQLEAQVVRLEETIKEKDFLIDRLNNHLTALDEDKLRSEFERTLKQHKDLAKLEQEQIEIRCETLEQQMIAERISSSNLLQEFQSKLDDKQKSHEQILSRLEEKIVNKQEELDQLLSEPQNELIKSLREDKVKLTNEVSALESVLGETKAKQDSLAKRVQSLVKEAEQSRLSHEEESSGLQSAYLDQRRKCNQLRMQLTDKDEELQITEFNLERSEKRVASLLETLKSKEEAYTNLIESLDARHELQLERSTGSVRNLEEIITQQASQLELKQNEITRLELRHQSQLDSMRIDRDERLTNLNDRLQRLESELEVTRSRLNEEINDKQRITDLADQSRSEANQFRSETDRLTIELEKREAKLASKEKLLDEQIDMLREQQAIRSSIEHGVDIDNVVLDEARRHAENLEKSVAILRTENEKLVSKLQISETSLSQLNGAIAKERTKLVQDYEAIVEQVKSELRVPDKGRLRYRKYGYKLKHYLEHLRNVHSHICDTNCSQTGNRNESAL